MACFIEFFRLIGKSVPGRLITVLLYTVMLILIFVFFSGHGEFIYETF